MVTEMNTRRAYTMTARAEAVETTRRQILQATLDLAYERHVAAIRLDDVAEEAGVSVQTVLRHFGSRAGLIDATMAYGAGVVAEERRAPAGDVPAAVRAIVTHYETRGDQVLLMLAQEGQDETIRKLTDNGRLLHRRWVEEVFAPQLAGRPDTEALVDLLVVATDVYTWKLLRRDRCLSRSATEQRIRHLLSVLLGNSERDD